MFTRSPVPIPIVGSNLFYPTFCEKIYSIKAGIFCQMRRASPHRETPCRGAGRRWRPLRHRRKSTDRADRRERGCPVDTSAEGRSADRAGRREFPRQNSPPDCFASLPDLADALSISPLARGEEGSALHPPPFEKGGRKLEFGFWEMREKGGRKLYCRFWCSP